MDGFFAAGFFFTDFAGLLFDFAIPTSFWLILLTVNNGPMYRVYVN